MEFLDINSWNDRVIKAFNEAKSNVPNLQRELDTIKNVLEKTLTLEEREILESKQKDLDNTIDDLSNDISLGFYSLEVQDVISDYDKLMKEGVVLDKNNTNNVDRMMNISKNFLDIVKKYDNIIKISLPTLYQKKEVMTCVCGNNKDVEVVDGREYYCMKCGNLLKNNISTNTVYSDSKRANISTKYKYARTIHMQNCVRRIQGKQKVKLPPELFEDIQQKLELNGNIRILPQHVRDALQKTKWTDNYEDFVLIWSIIVKRSCPDFTHLEGAIFNDFNLVEREYNVIMADENLRKSLGKSKRSSFLSYPFLLYHLLRRHKYKCSLQFFNMLKPDSLTWLNSVLGLIYKRLGWEGFKPLEYGV